MSDAPEIAWRVSTAEIETALQSFLPSRVLASRDGRAVLGDAMRDAALGGGKRLRAHLVLESAACVGGEAASTRAMAAACALEMVHAYSLVHDDLPAMDDAPTRRGQPSSHVQYGEAMAILAGDGLLTLAFETLARGDDAALTLRAIRLLAEASGEAGMVGGQAIDITWSDREYSPRGDELLEMHSMKTGALIRASCEIGALLGGGSATQIGALHAYGTHLGCVFQITDDLLDAVGDPAHTGKASSDAQNGKITATAVFGLDGARELARTSCNEALRFLKRFGEEANALRQLADFVLHREK